MWNVRDDYPAGTPRNCCYVCQTGIRELPSTPTRKEKVLDPQIQIDFEGYLCICESCITEAAQMLGMFTIEQAGQLKNVEDYLREELEATRAQLFTAEDALTGLQSFVQSRLTEPEPEPEPEPVPAKAIEHVGQ